MPWLEYSPIKICHLISLKNKFLAGEEYTVTDALSRLEVHNTAGVLTFDNKAMTTAQDNDDEYHNILLFCTSVHLQKSQLFYCSCSLWFDMFAWTLGPLVHEVFSRQMFDALHSLAHPGIHQNDFVQIGLAVHQQRYSTTDTRLLAMPAIWNIVAQEDTHRRAFISGRPNPTHPDSRGRFYLLTMLNRFTGFPVAVPIQNSQKSQSWRA